MHIFCRALLRLAREDAERTSVNQKLYTQATGTETNRTYEVQDSQGNLIWRGRADCKWEAKAHALIELVKNSTNPPTKQLKLKMLYS